MDSSQANIFVVDDDKSVRKSLSRLLRSAGFAVQTFASGQELLASAPLPGEGVVILDLRMPVLNGLEVQRELLRRGSHMPVIFITAHEDEQARSTALAAGALGFVPKPFDQDILLELLRTARDHGQPRRNGRAMNQNSTTGREN